MNKKFKDYKVVHMTSAHGAFDDRIFHKEVKSLSNAGYKVVLIAPHDKKELIGNIEIIPIPKARNRLERMAMSTIRVLYLALKQKADVYHFHDPELIPAGFIIKLFTGKKVVYDVHEHYPKDILDKYYIPKIFRYLIAKIFDSIEKIFVPFFNFVIYATSIIGDRYKMMSVSSELIANYPLLRLSRSFKKDPQKYIIYLGGMTSYRGIHELLEAFSKVVKNHQNWSLYLVGEITPESFSKEISELIFNLNIKEKVKLISWVPYEEKEKYSSISSIGVVNYLPYANNMSGLPNKLFDYMLIGLPVVTSNFPLYKEIVNGSKCGIPVDPTNPKEIAKAIEYLIEHPDEAKQMGENGRKAVLEKYNWEHEEKKLLRIYEELLNK